MKKLALNSLRTIKRNWTRLLSITILIALSNFVLIGLFSAGPNMRKTIAETYQREHLADAHIVSTDLISEDDKTELSKASFIKAIEYQTVIDAKLNDKMIRLVSLPEKISKFDLTQGRLPKKEDEIAIGEQSQHQLGDTITIISKNLTSSHFKVVGIVKSSEFMSKTSLGVTPLGDGTIHYFGVLTKNTFQKTDNVAKIIFKDTEKKEVYSKTYSVAVEKNITSLEKITQRLTNKHRELALEEISKALEDIELARDQLKSSKEAIEKQIITIEQLETGDINTAGIDEQFQQEKKQLIAHLEEIKNQDNKLNEQKMTLENRKKQLDFLTLTVENRSEFSVGYSDYGNTATRIDILATILPVIFFIISLMVSITTMKRMVTEKRIEMGALRSLGFTKNEVMREFIIFSGITALLGSLIGALLGIYLLPKMIFNIFSNGSYILDEMIVVYQWPLISLSFTVSFFSTLLAVYFAAKNELKEFPSQLMHTKAPQKKNTIFLESFPRLWQSISFSNKLTLRNSFRYKSRLLMTILGVMLSTSLLILGIGIKDSLSLLVPTQYQEITTYDMMTLFNPHSLDLKDYQKTIDDFANQKKKILFKNLSIHDNGFLEPQSVQLFVANDLTDYIALDNKPTEKGVVVTQKLASSLGLKNGDDLIVKDLEGYSKNLAVIGMTSNHVGHMIYMTPDYYESVFKEAYQENAYLIKSQKAIDSFLKKITQYEASVGILQNKVLKQNVRDFLKGLDGILMIIVTISMLLVLIVLFTLTSINISEREKELATIKVLGFYQKEVLLYIFKETILLTLIGILFGIGLGYLLHRFVMTVLPPARLLAIQGLTWHNVAIATGAVLSFTIVVMLIMNRHIRKIDMLTALKSVE
ncbi:ABC transporter permease [Streptococcus zalophi]|uniref:FtsX-like permease family protein n=1 Tax=Streptococcus zalophi TaxID=640031 RepID=A0A934P926_9STRE|nr:ABC transporter permease [Streptococcus zalophi]MBJ8349273.1 FtsX-like permease family protein [Streptococcus zalophi]MCR8967105.1 FtsX-like permease family protein [Streptococcus zalophi]